LRDKIRSVAKKRCEETSQLPAYIQRNMNS
jgi:hypothetical protein